MTTFEMARYHYPERWGIETIQELLVNNKISIAEYLELVPITEDNPITDEMLTLFRKSKLNELRSACNSMIENGVDVQTSNSGKDTEHFSLDSYDQNNITNMFYSVMAGVEEYPYHADGKACTTYHKSDIVAIYIAAQSTITYHTTYNNVLRELVNRTEDIDELMTINYGMNLPEDLATIMQSNIASAQIQIQKILTTLSGQAE